MTDDYTPLEKYFGELKVNDLIIYPNNKPELNIRVVNALIEDFREMGEEVKIKHDHNYNCYVVNFPLDPVGFPDYQIHIYHDEVFLLNLYDDSQEYLDPDCDCTIAEQIIKYFYEKLSNQIYTIAPITYNIAAYEYHNIHNQRAPIKHLHRLNFIYLLHLITSTNDLDNFNYDLLGDVHDMEQIKAHFYYLTIGHHSEKTPTKIRELIQVINSLKTNGNL